jgi:hypothetical protein
MCMPEVNQSLIILSHKPETHIDVASQRYQRTDWDVSEKTVQGVVQSNTRCQRKI